MKNRLRVTAMILALLFAASLFSACSYSKSEETEPATAAPAETEPTRDPVKIHVADPDNGVRAKAYLEEAPGGDLGGMDIFITGPSAGTLSPDGVTYISEDISRRNQAVEKKLNVRLDFSEAAPDVMLADAAASIASGLYYTDVMLLPLGNVGAFYNAGCLYNLESMPYLDLSAPYFNARSVAALSPGRYCLGFASGAYPALLETPALFYCRAIEGDDPGMMERAAAAGTLTWDFVFAAAAENLSLLGDGAYTVSVGSPAATLPQTVYLTGTGNVLTNTPATPSVAFYPEWLASASAVTGKIYAASPAQDGEPELFKSGKTAYRIEYVKNAASLNGAAEFGAVPLPKMTAEGEYRALVSPNCPVFTVIAGTTNSEEISLVLTALSAASYGVIPESFVDEVIVTAMRDDRSGDMLGLIAETAEFDLSSAVSASSDAVNEATVQYIGQAAYGVSGDFERLADAANDALAAMFG